MGTGDVDLVIAGPVWTGRGIQRGLAVRGGRVTAVGDAALALRATAREVVDAPDGLAGPGAAPRAGGPAAGAPAPPPRPPPRRAPRAAPPPPRRGGRGGPPPP